MNELQPAVAQSKIKAIIFDLDGTLLDTLADLAGAMNRVLEDLGFPSHSTEAYKLFVGEGVRVLVTRALPTGQREETMIDKSLGLMKEEYGKSWHVSTKPYQGIHKLLAVLRERQILSSVLTNKPHSFASDMVKRYFPDHPFASVHGAMEGEPRKPDPAAALQIADELGIRPAEMCFLGDTWTDMKTAGGAGMLPIGVLWGFRSGEELRENGAAVLIAEPLDLLLLLDLEYHRT